MWIKTFTLLIAVTLAFEWCVAEPCSSSGSGYGGGFGGGFGFGRRFFNWIRGPYYPYYPSGYYPPYPGTPPVTPPVIPPVVPPVVSPVVPATASQQQLQQLLQNTLTAIANNNAGPVAPANVASHNQINADLTKLLQQLESQIQTATT